MEQTVNYYDEITVRSKRSDIHSHIENIRLKGYTLVEGLIDEALAKEFSKKVDSVYARQCEELGGEDKLTKMGEIGVARNLVDYDADFFKLIANEEVMCIVGNLLGKYYSLMYQSGIVNTPMVKKYPSNWHRDIIHQNFTSSKPLAISVIFCIDDFTKENGGTVVIPFSHNVEQTPSEDYNNKEQLAIEAKKGSVLILNSMLLHKTGDNVSREIRRAVVNVYSLPFINQPFHFSDKVIANQPIEQRGLASKLLGVPHRSHTDVSTYRNKRLA